MPRHWQARQGISFPAVDFVIADRPPKAPPEFLLIGLRGKTVPTKVHETLSRLGRAHSPSRRRSMTALEPAKAESVKKTLRKAGLKQYQFRNGACGGGWHAAAYGPCWPRFCSRRWGCRRM